MIVWNIEGADEFTRHLYDVCRRLGAPRFFTPEQMEKWVKDHFDEVKSHLYNFAAPITAIVCEATGEVFGSLRRILYLVQYQNVGVKVRIQLMLTCIFKALHKPIQLFPKSLRPDESAAY